MECEMSILFRPSSNCLLLRFPPEEYDHLDGIVYIDRLSEEERKKVQPRLNELIDEFGDGGEL